MIFPISLCRKKCVLWDQYHGSHCILGRMYSHIPSQFSTFQKSLNGRLLATLCFIHFVIIHDKTSSYCPILHFQVFWLCDKTGALRRNPHGQMKNMHTHILQKKLGWTIWNNNLAIIEANKATTRQNSGHPHIITRSHNKISLGIPPSNCHAEHCKHEATVQISQ